MTRALYELSLEELKILYDEGKITRENFLYKTCGNWTGFHWLANGNKEALNLFKFLNEKELIFREDLLLQTDFGYTVNHLMACWNNNVNEFEYFEWGSKEGLIFKEDLLVQDEDGARVLDCLSEEDREAVLALFEEKIEN